MINLKKRFPKTWAKLAKEFAEFYNTFLGEEIRSDDYLRTLEFFDSVGIHAGIVYRMGLYYAEVEQYNDIHASTRTAATEAAIEKCFEIREKQLEEEK